jgi:hypothetical protein
VRSLVSHMKNVQCALAATSAFFCRHPLVIDWWEVRVANKCCFGTRRAMARDSLSHRSPS